MKRQGQCPKCASDDLYRGDYVHAGSPGWWLAIVPNYRKRQGALQAYVYRNCGDAESYVKHLNEIPPPKPKQGKGSCA